LALATRSLEVAPSPAFGDPAAGGCSAAMVHWKADKRDNNCPLAGFRQAGVFLFNFCSRIVTS
jgi:hypothetical protein